METLTPFTVSGHKSYLWKHHRQSLSGLFGNHYDSSQPEAWVLTRSAGAHENPRLLQYSVDCRTSRRCRGNIPKPLFPHKSDVKQSVAMCVKLTSSCSTRNLDKANRLHAYSNYITWNCKMLSLHSNLNKSCLQLTHLAPRPHRKVIHCC